jgi:hypothetical protein
MVYLADGAAPHAQCMRAGPEAFKEYMDDFLDRHVSGFGVVETEEWTEE